MFWPVDIIVDNKTIQGPLILQMGKEMRKTLEVQAILNEDMKNMFDRGFPVNGTDKTMKVDMHTMFDRKAGETYL